MTSTTNLGLAITSILGIVAIVFLVLNTDNFSFGNNNSEEDISENFAGEASRARMMSGDEKPSSSDDRFWCATSCNGKATSCKSSSRRGDCMGNFEACMKGCGFDLTVTSKG